MTAGPSRVVVTGASGNVGTGVLRALASQLPDTEVVGVCRRPPTHGAPYERVRWHAVDLAAPSARADLESALQGADVVVHLALAVQPVRDEDYLYRANVLGTQALLRAMSAAGTPRLVYASSLGIYAPGSDTPVSEDWPTTGQATSVYSRHKVMVEQLLDEFEIDHSDVTVARFRPTVVVQREAAWLIKSLYLGPVVPITALEMLRRRELPVLPLPARLKLQFVHADDVGDAVVRLITRQVRGSFNIAADVLDTAALADLVGARPVDVPPRLVRAVISALSAARIVALTPGWYDVAFNTPLMDTTKARQTLGWAPSRSSADSARELIEGLADGAVGTSAAMGWELRPRRDVRAAIDRTHDVTLALWGAVAFARATGVRRGRAVDVAIVAANLVSGTPMAVDRVLERRADPVALMAPIAVCAALGATVRGGWPAVAATGALQWLRLSERARRATRLRRDKGFSTSNRG
ncbi:NAD-dependent epimerase/dehydratase family protein [Mycolicibacterium sp. S2-37]|uniref:NAD-dependent epimerase/dehydratase family protein n=1 Tax=Mycolicibacterium sp. S2-37 TaxID=2810297 RepID=UPI001A93BE8D|nr:NAD-dependent epimerase/dehydratase family protein [Mycolicibacterium sp. S2-37]MBO0681288.1 NAD-dependent epimerase/dehydratase family protein [Mycolicibacterium sp. S2-37]